MVAENVAADAAPVAARTPGWTAGAVARHLGVAASTLRSWSRRYGLEPTEHASGRHRRYGANDIARLEKMCQLIAQGVAPSEAAHWVQHQPVTTAAPVAEPDRPRSPGATRAVAGLVSAALRLDSIAISAAVAEHLRVHGVIDTWDTICLPAVTELGLRTAASGECIDAEHLLTWAITAALHRVSPGEARPGGRSALLACAEDERHTLGLDALCAALTERGVLVRMLGAATPSDTLADAVRRITPAAVVVWAQTPRTARASALRALTSGSSTATTIIAAGSGWAEQRLPSEVILADSLREAVLLTLGATHPATT
ncbi:MerR family transcriptional regulator [Pseudonocardia spinosispora]|uniref:MerR family transcriptional regulator n=1 Tax=Pseudonocardia spinosispora TaxID=103441 RepID=UPI00041478C4|nr:MerR family transcriptional regulator [Pseudonocardia spinosispora]